MSRSPCVRCGRSLHTGDSRVLMSFTPDDLERVARDATLVTIRDRALCALGTIDAERERSVREDLAREAHEESR